VPASIISHRQTYRFEVKPEELWERIEEVDQFERWWPWLSEFWLEGSGIEAGTILHGVVTPPLPYRMRLQIELVEAVRPKAVDAVIGGDLRGQATLRLHADGEATRAEAAWEVEMLRPSMRLASRIGRPLLQWGHDRVVETTVSGFRRRIEPPLVQSGHGQSGSHKYHSP